MHFNSSRTVFAVAIVTTATFGMGTLPATADGVWQQHSMDRPRPEAMVPPAVDAVPGTPPDDAVMLFDGDSLDAWKSVEGEAAGWKVENGEIVIVPGAAAIETKQAFGDAQLHVEWSEPVGIEGESQGRGNSGVYLMKKYEVQVLDSYENETYADGQAAAIYGMYPPLVNVTRPPGEWNVYDIYFRRPRFNAAGGVNTPARLTVVQNGVLVQNNEELWGGTNWVQALPYASHPDSLPIMLQDHGNPVRFRNIWVRPITARPEPGTPKDITPIELTAKELDQFVGDYERGPGQITTVRRDGERLLTNVLGADLEIVPVADNMFVFTRSDVTLNFEMNEKDEVEGLVMSLGGDDYPARRVDDP